MHIGRRRVRAARFAVVRSRRVLVAWSTLYLLETISKSRRFQDAGSNSPWAACSASLELLVRGAPIFAACVMMFHDVLESGGFL